MKSTFQIAGVILLSIAIFTIGGCSSGGHRGYKKTTSGIYYKVYTKDNPDTTAIYTGSVVTMNIVYGKLDTTIFDSRNMPNEVRFPIPESQFEGDFYEAIRLFNQGDSGSFILKAGPFFHQTVGQPELPPYITEEEDLYFTIMIEKVQSQDEIAAEEQAMLEKMRQGEQEVLQRFVESNNITVSPDENGIYYIEKVKGTGNAPVTDGYASVHFSVFDMNNEQIFSSYERGEPIDFKYGSPFENEGFQVIVGKMKKGGKSEALVPSSMAFGAEGAGNVIDPFTPLYYKVELVDVMTPEQYNKKVADREAKKLAQTLKKDKEEEAILQKYLADNGITPTTVLPSGLVYVETLKGTGPKPVDGKKVKVHYTGRLLDGTIFDSSIERGEPLEFAIGRRAVIEGWDKGIALMNEGGKATLVIPSKLAYKDRGAGERIPPYSTLVFEVELVMAEQ